ncbi:hypothetical protein LDENG_00016550, partial [Lucifuga dentata]
MEESAVQRRGSRAYQIFPEVNMDDDSDSSSYPDDFLYQRKCLPSIVVEPTEHGEQESGELRWPPGKHLSSNDDDDEEEENISAEHTEASVDGEQDTGMEE